jgi:hypothetical protein
MDLKEGENAKEAEGDEDLKPPHQCVWVYACSWLGMVLPCNCEAQHMMMGLRVVAPFHFNFSGIEDTSGAAKY